MSSSSCGSKQRLYFCRKSLNIGLGTHELAEALYNNWTAENYFHIHQVYGMIVVLSISEIMTSTGAQRECFPQRIPRFCGQDFRHCFALRNFASVVACLYFARDSGQSRMELGPPRACQLLHWQHNCIDKEIWHVRSSRCKLDQGHDLWW